MADNNLTEVNSRIIENEGGLIAPSESTYISDKQSAILDKSWLSNAFMIPDTGFKDEFIQTNRYYSSANVKFTDSRLGCNIGINPRPQWCHYSDIPVSGRLTRNPPSLTGVSGNYGMGRQYSEFIDDPAQRIYMSFGVPQFNSLIGFLGTAYETNQVTMARTGRAKSIFYTASQVVGFAMLASSFAAVAMVIYGAKVLTWFRTRPTSKFYTMKETMPLYWSAVNQLVNSMAINRGILPTFLDPAGEAGSEQRIGRPYKLDEQYLDTLTTMMPEVFRKNSLGTFYFDMLAVANRAAIISARLLKDEYESLDKGEATDFTGYVKRTLTGQETRASRVTNRDGGRSMGAIVDRYVTDYVTSAFSLEGFYKKVADVKSYITGEDPKNEGVEVNLRADKMRREQEAPKLADYIDSQIHDGTLFATFIVDHTGPVNESWSNSVTESELSKKLNGIVSDMASARFSLAEGNILGSIQQSIVTAVTDTVSGALSGFTGGLSNVVEGLAGAGYMDVPKHWQSSSYNAAKSSYSIQLITPYGNPISQLINLDIPLAMLIAGALPRSTGRASYTAPFLCQIYDRGRCQHRLAMIESLSFNRGTSHLGFNDIGSALAIDVTFSVVDLSSIMHMPISTGFIGDIDIAQDEDNVMVDFLAVLAGRSIESQIYAWPKARLKYANLLVNYSKLTSSSYLGMVFGNTSVAEALKWFTRQTTVLNPTGEF